jgi:hypothetical protein
MIVSVASFFFRLSASDAFKGGVVVAVAAAVVALGFRV